MNITNIKDMNLNNSKTRNYLEVQQEIAAHNEKLLKN